MGRALGQDFGPVRVHTDATAAESAAAVGAQAYTVGNDIVFGAGQYQPGSERGGRLIGHELAHVIQQRGSNRSAEPQSHVPMSDPSDASEREAEAVSDALASGGTLTTITAAPRSLQRKCGPHELAAPDPDCTRSDEGVSGWSFNFNVGCDVLLPGEEATFSKFKAGNGLNIHGFASHEGPEQFNWDLSCHRANRIAEMAHTLRPDCPVIATFKHGPSPVSGPGLVPDPHPLQFWRMVVVQEAQPAPAQPQPSSTCGPDATDWLISQVASARSNKSVLLVQSKLRDADIAAAKISPPTKLHAMDMLEGQVARMVGAASQAAGRPTPTADANAQLGAPTTVAGDVELTAAQNFAAAGNSAALDTLFALRDAAKQWSALVGAGRPYDFKVDPKTMANPTSAHCPDSDCQHTITLCPGSSGDNCFEQDLPGNVVFAHIGAFVGFSENALQLGSQWAQLQVSGGQHWDPPEDTHMISFAFGLPSPLTRADFCAALSGAKSGFATHKCKDCSEQTTASIINP